MIRHPFFPLYAAAVGIVMLAAANGIHAAMTPPDVTVMPCSAWADTAHPRIPANTLTDACVDDAGTLHTAPSSTDETARPAP